MSGIRCEKAISEDYVSKLIVNGWMNGDEELFWQKRKKMNECYKNETLYEIELR